MNCLKLLILLLLLMPSLCWGQLKIVSWNVKNLGKSKTEEQFELMIAILKDADIIAIQEIVKSYYGARAVRVLVKKMNHAYNNKYAYALSSATVDANPYKEERYAYIYNKSKVRLIGMPYLLKELDEQIIREPYCAEFSYKGARFKLVNIHAATKKDNPYKEVAQLKLLPSRLKTQNIIFLGDFNISVHDNVFNPLKKRGWASALKNAKTTLRQQCRNNECLANSLDHILYNTKFWNKLRAGTIPFYRYYHFDMKKARKLSDHIPIFIYLNPK